MKFCLVLLFIFPSIICAFKKLPELESLYDSSDPDLPWPPEGQDFSGKQSEWPGQGTRFGKVWPRIKVEVLDDPTIKFDSFNKKYLSQSKPVVIDGLVPKMLERSQFKMDAKDLVDTGRAAITFFDAKYIKKNEIERMSFREFLLSLQEEEKTYYVKTNLHKNFKTQLRFPDLLRCSDLMANLHDTQHNHYSHTVPLPIRECFQDKMYCQVEGEREVLLIDPKDFPSWKDLELSEDKEQGRLAPFVNIYNIAYHVMPELKDIKKMHIARLRPGQCLFLPAGWIQQHNIMGGDHSFELAWKHMDNFETCDGDEIRAPTWANLAYKYEGYKPIERSVDSVKMQVDKMSYVIDKYLFHKEPIRNVEDFIAMLKEDGVLMQHLEEWNDELQESSKELFKIMDRNGDKQLDKEDLIGLKEENMDFWLGRIDDRHDDFSEVIFDRRFDDYRGNMGPTQEELDQYAQAIRDAGGIEALGLADELKPKDEL